MRSYTREVLNLYWDLICVDADSYVFVRNNPVSLADKLGLKCCCTPGQMDINKVQGQWTFVDTKPGDHKWVDVLKKGAEYCPGLKPIADAVDKAMKAFVGFSEIYLSTGFQWNVYVRVEFKCCTKSGKWGPNRSLGPEQVTDDRGEGAVFLQD